MSWWEDKFWNVYDHPATAAQYLAINNTPRDGTMPLNEVDIAIGERYICEDGHNNTTNKAITLEAFKAMPIDIIIASIPQHVKPFQRLIRELKPNAKLVFQMGNMFNEVNDLLRDGDIKNLLASVKPFQVPDGVNAVFYHQEFDTLKFNPTDLPPLNFISSFINILPRTGHADKFYALKTALPEYIFKSYGAQCDDGIINTTASMKAEMCMSKFGFHAKYMGDGFGHVLYNWFACGRPVLTCFSDYKDKLGGELLEDGVTAIDLDRYTIAEVCDKIRTMPNDTYQQMCRSAYDRFKVCVSYETEAERIKEWITKM